jgi:signal transduction histidine kinase
MSDRAQTTVDLLRAAELAAVAEEVASVLRHDLRNKLAAIRNAAFYVRRRLAKTEAWTADPRLDEMSDVIQKEANASNELLNQTLTLKHLFAPAVARIAARECVRQAIACARMPREPALRVALDAHAGNVVVDPTELMLAIRCLIENAAEAMEGVGVIEVRARSSESHYIVEVGDHGPGIAATERALVLKPFHTTKKGHAGLGLNIAARVAQRYRGRVAVGDPPSGASVAIHLPLPDATHAR